MEKLYFNLSVEEFPKGKKILLWSFSALFLLSGIYVLIINLAFQHKSVPLALAVITFGISIFVAAIAAYASVKRKDLYFLVDDEKIEFRFGIFSPEKHIFKWADIKELIMPHKQKKAILCLNDGSTFKINLNWLDNKKASRIRKQLYLMAKEKNLNIVKVANFRKTA